MVEVLDFRSELRVCVYFSLHIRVSSPVFVYSGMGICLRALLPVKKTGPSGLDWGLAHGSEVLCSMFVSLRIVRCRDMIAFRGPVFLLCGERSGLSFFFFLQQLCTSGITNTNTLESSNSASTSCVIDPIRHKSIYKSRAIHLTHRNYAHGSLHPHHFTHPFYP